MVHSQLQSIFNAILLSVSFMVVVLHHCSVAILHAAENVMSFE